MYQKISFPSSTYMCRHTFFFKIFPNSLCKLRFNIADLLLQITILTNKFRPIYVMLIITTLVYNLLIHYLHNTPRLATNQLLKKTYNFVL